MVVMQKDSNSATSTGFLFTDPHTTVLKLESEVCMAYSHPTLHMHTPHPTHPTPQHTPSNNATSTGFLFTDPHTTVLKLESEVCMAYSHPTLVQHPHTPQ